MLFLKDYKKETISEVLQADNDKREKEAAKMKKLHDDAAAMMASARIIVPKDAPSARLLWTTNRTDADGWVQWDSQVGLLAHTPIRTNQSSLLLTFYEWVVLCQLLERQQQSEHHNVEQECHHRVHPSAWALQVFFISLHLLLSACLSICLSTMKTKEQRCKMYNAFIKENQNL